MRFKVLKYRLRTSNERIETKICQSRSRGLKATKETSVPRRKSWTQIILYIFVEVFHNFSNKKSL